MTRRKHKPEDLSNEPMLDNYPALKRWLFSDQINARCAWQLGTDRDSRMRVEGWLIRGQLVVITLYADKGGWNIYTAHSGIDIPATLRDAESRLGINECTSRWHCDPATVAHACDTPRCAGGEALDRNKPCPSCGASK